MIYYLLWYLVYMNYTYIKIWYIYINIIFIYIYNYKRFIYIHLYIYFISSRNVSPGWLVFFQIFARYQGVCPRWFPSQNRDRHRWFRSFFWKAWRMEQVKLVDRWTKNKWRQLMYIYVYVCVFFVSISTFNEFISNVFRILYVWQLLTAQEM